MSRSKIMGLMACCATVALNVQAVELEMSRSGSATLSQNGKTIMTMSPGYFGAGWSYGGFGFDASTNNPNVIHTQAERNGVTLDMEARMVSNENGHVVMNYKLTPKADIKLESLHVGLAFPTGPLTGRKVIRQGVDDMIWPNGFRDVVLKAPVEAEGVTLDTADGILELKFTKPLPVLLQDDRQWGDSFTVRLGPQYGGKVWPGGTPFEAEIDIFMSGGIKYVPAVNMVLTANDDWIALDERLNVKPGSAVDFSHFGFAEGPAGKYGWVRAVDGHFEFTDKPGVPQRFYGVNFCFAAHDLTHERSEELAERLWRLGYNTVRYHHYESNLQETKNGDSTELRPDRLERMDYLHYALTKRGIYITTDTFVSRRVFAKDVFPGAEGNLDMNEIKMLLPVSDAMFENWKGFCRSFLGHKNPYTGKTYAQDPAVAWISLVNENNFGNYYGGLQKRTMDVWIAAWTAWADKKYGSAAARNRAWGVADDFVITKLAKGEGTMAMQRDFARFECELEVSMYRRMTAFLKDELGSKALFTDMNSWTNPLWTQIARSEFDYVDDHFYIDHPVFLGKSWQLPSRCDNRSPVRAGACGGGHTAFTRLLDKPFTITEYNFSGPGRYRGVGGIMLGCLAALQDWSGLWRFAYSHGNYNMFHISNMGYFDLATDPLNQCAERAAICLYMRGDMGVAERTVAMAMPKNYLESDFPVGNGLAPSWQRMNVIAKVGYQVAPAGAALKADASVGFTDDAPQGQTRLEGEPKSGAAATALKKLFRDKGWLSKDNITDDAKAIAQSTNGQFTIDGQRDVLTLNTPRTAGGYAPVGETVKTAAADIKVLDTDATVWVMSVDGQDIVKSHRLLVTHLTDLQNTNAMFADRDRRILMKWGNPPHIVKNGRAEVLIRLPQTAKVSAWRIANDGERLSEFSVTQVPEGIRLDLSIAGPHGAQLMYELVVE